MPRPVGPSSKTAMFIATLILTPIMLVCALVVRFAGDSRVLNVIDYSRVSNPQALHAWAGNRLLALTAICATLAGCSLVFPQVSPLLFATAVIAIVIVAIWIAVGSVRFHQVHPRPEA